MLFSCVCVCVCVYVCVCVCVCVCVLGENSFVSLCFIPKGETNKSCLLCEKSTLYRTKSRSLLFWGQTHISGQDQYVP